LINRVTQIFSSLATCCNVVVLIIGSPTFRNRRARRWGSNRLHGFRCRIRYWGSSDRKTILVITRYSRTLRVVDLIAPRATKETVNSKNLMIRPPWSVKMCFESATFDRSRREKDETRLEPPGRSEIGLASFDVACYRTVWRTSRWTDGKVRGEHDVSGHRR